MSTIGPTREQVQKALAGWQKRFGENDPNPYEFVDMPYVEFGCYAQLDSVVDIYVMGFCPINDDECKIDGRWGDMSGKPRVSIWYNFKTKVGTMEMERVN
jgi:hypothetical protein